MKFSKKQSIARKTLNQYIPIPARIEVTDKQLCAIDKDVDTCEGDSGGPLTITRESLGRGEQ